MKNQRRQVGARFVARARGAFGFAGVKGTRNGAGLRQTARRGPNVTQHGPSVTNSVDAERTQTLVQLAGLPESLRSGALLPGSQTVHAAAAG
jgi:hypothetical protein